QARFWPPTLGTDSLLAPAVSQGTVQRGHKDVAADPVVGVVEQYVLAGSLCHAGQSRLVLQSLPDDRGQAVAFHGARKGVHSVEQRRIAGDRRRAKHRDREAKARFVMAKTVPAESLRRPRQPGARAALQIFGLG